MIAVWNNGQSYSDETIKFINISPLSKEEFVELMQLAGRYCYSCRDAFLIGWTEQLDVVAVNSQYTIDSLRQATENWFWDTEPDDEEMTQQQLIRLKELRKKGGL